MNSGESKGQDAGEENCKEIRRIANAG